MEEKENVKRLLSEVNNDITKIIELEKYDKQKVVDVALSEKLFESLLIIFKPITINGVTKIYLDPFSTNLLDEINSACETKEEAEMKAKEEIEMQQAINEALLDDAPSDKLSYEELLSSILIIPKEIKEALKKTLFTIDMDLIGKIKIKDSHAREIAGIAHPIKTVEDVIYYAEPACIKPCIELFNKNIVTTMNDTFGVIEDMGAESENPECYITCDYNTLSQENKDIFEELIKAGVANRLVDRGIDSVSINVPCSGDETVAEISDKLLVIVSKLKMQDYTYGRQTLESFYENSLANLAYEYESIYQKCFDKAECTWDDVIMFAEEIGYFYDPDEDMLWVEKEYYEKHKNYVLNNHGRHDGV